MVHVQSALLKLSCALLTMTVTISGVADRTIHLNSLRVIFQQFPVQTKVMKKLESHHRQVTTHVLTYTIIWNGSSKLFLNLVVHIVVVNFIDSSNR